MPHRPLPAETLPFHTKFPADLSDGDNGEDWSPVDEGQLEQFIADLHRQEVRRQEDMAVEKARIERLARHIYQLLPADQVAVTFNTIQEWLGNQVSGYDVAQALVQLRQTNQISSLLDDGGRDYYYRT
jgi:hypothetical protein